ncbi:MAG: hypothetical protein H6624_00140 [Bdellovibrionaceae bacterium]|nr:hypothetical protein [Bdellovibrionales bacterium]MCB9082715.1 hypothetical protein [Pseudobdellovibrionaceae bacterium]
MRHRLLRTALFFFLGFGLPTAYGAEDLSQICKEQGGTWIKTKHGNTGCKCADGKYLKNVYFDVCSHSRRKVIRRDARPKEDKPGTGTEWGQKGQAWALSSKRKSLPSPQEVLRSFVQELNAGNVDGAMSLVNDHDVHPSREIDGINELLRRFSSVATREWDLRKLRSFSAVAEPDAKFSGCLYFEEYTTTIADGADESRGLGRMHIYCAHYSAKSKGKYPLAQARNECPKYKPKITRFVCKVGRIDMF